MDPALGDTRPRLAATRVPHGLRRGLGHEVVDEIAGGLVVEDGAGAAMLHACYEAGVVRGNPGALGATLAT